MSAAVTYEGDVRRSVQAVGGLFAGQKLWFSRGVPTRSWLLQNAELNGAQVVQLEQQADIRLVDHAKKNQAPGTHSYRYVELSIRNGRLEDLDAHRVGSTSRVHRPVGSIVTAAKGGRNKFTEEEDQLLWNWVKPYMDAGGSWKGNEIYKQLESLNPRHTYQSWRDRWIKHTQYHNRRISATTQHNDGEAVDQLEQSPRTPKRRRTEGPDQAKPSRANIGAVQSRQVTSSSNVAQASSMVNAGSRSIQTRDRAPHERNALNHTSDTNKDTSNEIDTGNSNNLQQETHIMVKAEGDQHKRKPEMTRLVEDEERSVSADGSRLPLAFNFTQHEARMLYKATCHILDARPDKLDESWAGVAKEHGHTKDAWRKYFYEVIVPEYMKRHDIHNHDDLQIYCKAELQADRERRGLVAQEQNAEKDKDDMDIEKAIEEGNTEVDEEFQPETIQFDGTVESSRPAQDRDHRTSSTRLPQARGYPVPNLHFAATNHKPPQPNESRKLSQGRSTQSTSSHAQSLPISQTTQQSAQHKARPKTLASSSAGHAENIRLQLEIIKELAQEVRLRKSQPSVQADRKGHSSSQEAVVVSQNSNEQETNSVRFVTQVSEEQQTNSRESSAQLQDIAYRASTPPRPGNGSLSPLFVPKPSEHLSPRVVDQPRNERYDKRFTEAHGSPSAVRLVDGYESDGSLHSESAPSEAPSEAIHFESQAGLSQAWETAPDQISDNRPSPKAQDQNGEMDNDDDLTAFDEWRTSAKAGTQLTTGEHGTSSIGRGHAPIIQNRSQSSLVLSTQDQFETAPGIPQASTTLQLEENDIKHYSNPHGAVNGKLDTQALFQQATQVDLARAAAIPEPPGGWDDDELHTSTGMTPIPTNPGLDLVEEADWTLPLPDPDLPSEGSPQSPIKASEDEDINVWLDNQPKIYPSVPSILIKPFLHSALESTSIDLNLATSVLARMVRRFEKGKGPADLSSDDIQKLPKSKRKAAISKLAKDLIPSDIPGCWPPEDDKALMGVNGREVKRVEDKHGPQLTKSRFEFLEMWNAER